MRCGLVGHFTNYRPQEVKSIKHGILDVNFDGDTQYPAETHEIKCFDAKLCAYLIQTLSEIEKPILNMLCWIDLRAKDPTIILLEVLDVYDPSADQQDET